MNKSFIFDVVQSVFDANPADIAEQVGYLWGKSGVTKKELKRSFKLGKHRGASELHHAFTQAYHQSQATAGSHSQPNAFGQSQVRMCKCKRNPGGPCLCKQK